MSRLTGGVLAKAVFVYFISVFIAIGIGVLFDEFFVLPLVEVDDALRIVNTATPATRAVRNIGAITLPITVNIGFLVVYIWPVFRVLATGIDPTASSLVLSRVIRAPQVIGTIALVGWISAFFFITAIDLATLEFPIPNERAVYVATTFSAMFASGLLLFMALYLSTDFLNRRLMIPVFFPDGRVSGRGLVKPMSFTTRLLFLWLALSR